MTNDMKLLQALYVKDGSLTVLPRLALNSWVHATLQPQPKWLNYSYAPPCLASTGFVVVCLFVC
jgi:hypothetical protein